MLGKTLRGRYNIIKQLGSGGFGTTFVAEDLDLPGNPWCVVKQLKPKDPDPVVFQTARRLFNTEAQVLYRLGKHDRIPQLFAHFEENQEFYLVQEFVEGEDLGSRNPQTQPYTETEAIALLQDILEILSFVHSQNVIHRDLKPSNLMQRVSDNRFVLIDFGAVKEISTLVATPQGQSCSTLSIGSPGYMPPEQRAGKPRLNSDLYALGMTVIYLLTGILPEHLPEDGQTGEVNWRPLVNSPDGVSPALALMIDKMVRTHFKDRYQSVQEVLGDLAKLQLPATILTQPLQPSVRPLSTQLSYFLAVMVTAGLSLGLAKFWNWQLPSQENVSPPLTPIAAATPKTLPTLPPPPVVSKPLSDLDEAMSLLKQGNTLMALQRYDEAIASLDQALKLKPDYADAWLEKGHALAQLQRYPQALDAYDEALKLNFDHAEAWYRRAIILNKMNRYQDAIAALNKTLDLQPEFTEAWSEKAYALTQLQHYEEALEIYNRILKFQQNSASYWFHRAQLLNRLHRYPDGLAALENAIELKPDYPEALVERAKTFGKMQRYEDALSALDQSLATTSELPVAWGERGSLLVELERYDEAIASLDKAVQLKPDYSEAWYYRGMALEKTQQSEAALTAFDKAVQIKPDYSEAWYYRGISLESLQKPEEALTSYEKAIQIWPANQAAIENRKRLLQELGH